MGGVSTAYQGPVARGVSEPAGPEPRRLRRPVEGRIVAGVCAGLAEHLNLAVTVVRLGFVGLALTGGAGVVLYLFLWALTPQTLLAPASAAAGHRAEGRAAADQAVRTLSIGLALVVLGGALLAQRAGVDLRLGILLPLMAVALGAVLTWTQLDLTERQRWRTGRGPGRRVASLRVLAGTALAVSGVVVLISRGRGLSGFWDVVVAALAVLLGVVVIAAPWAVRLWSGLREEQASRVRATERADIAAHLHDSVLQTLALIQRQAHDPTTVARLARAQERELRGWLYAGPLGSQESLAAAVTEAAHEVEDRDGTPVELVVTGDRPMDEAGAALVRALREALLNAVRHGQPPVSAYVEVGPTAVEAFVRDHGPGFDLDQVPPDRLGVRESILGRMSRHGGEASVRRLDDGTEVALVLPTAAVAGPAASVAAGGQP